MSANRRVVLPVRSLLLRGEPMESQVTMLRVYRELADWYERHSEGARRDRFLVLAMDAAQHAGQAEEAEKLRRHLLQFSPHHLLRPFGSFAEARQATDVKEYLRELRVKYPSEVAQELLKSLRSGAKSPPSAIGPTAPIARPNGSPSEPLKVFNEMETAVPEAGGQRPFPIARAVPLPLQSDLDQTLAPVPRGGRGPVDPVPWLRTKAESPSPKAHGGWFGLILFVVVFMAALAICGFVLVRPIVPGVVDPVKTPVQGQP
jgi:hypothetical protein